MMGFLRITKFKELSGDFEGTGKVREVCDDKGVV